MSKGEPELYKPADACKMAEVAPYVLRYWETEFPVLSERKEKAAGRLYTARDVKIISRIRELLYDEGFTVAGAKKRLEAEISEGRFDDGLSPAPPAAEQKAEKRAGKPAPRAPAEPAEMLFLADPPAGPKAATATTREATAPASADFPERRRVVKELKEIVRLLDRAKAR